MSETPASVLDNFDQLIERRPQYAAAFRSVETALWGQTVVGPVPLELCRLRIAQLLGCELALGIRTPAAVEAGLDEALVAALPRWPNDPRFDEYTRVCMALAEQLLMDADAITDQEVADIIATIGEDGFLVLSYACGMFETTQRARIVIGATTW